ncbi:hypothetical protein EDB89DRAFT_1906498 [Lactarius sanguifluus]|nr:hypothetical protein EDB89DRAFT_1906498 [Lactarius sanguifluus]
MLASVGDYTTHLAAAPLVGFVLWLIARRALKAFRNLPPGPKGLPIVGDVLHIADLDWLASSQRKDEYGEMTYWCRGGFVRSGPAWRWSGRGWRMRGQAVLLAMGVVRSCCVGVVTGLVGVVLGLVGVASGLVGVAPGLVGVVPGLVCCTGDFGMAWAGVARVAIVGPGSRRGICNVGVMVRHDGEMAWLGWR